MSMLADELCFASKPTLLRHLARLDELAPNIDPQGIFPEDWIIFRVTGYRKEIAEPALIPGRALLGDLSALAERLSEAATLTKDDVGPDAYTIGDLMDRWGVSRKTIDRYRRLGLIARRIDEGRGVRTLAFLPSAVEWFEHTNAERLGKAAQFTRSDTHEIQRIERWARTYRQRFQWSRSRTAARIAQRTGRCHEGVRKMLLRIDRETNPPIFSEPGPPSTREQLVSLRAYNRGVSTGTIAKRYKRNAPVVRRAINIARHDILIDCVPSLPEGMLAVLDTACLQTKPAREGLVVPRVVELNALIAMMRHRPASVVYEERSRAQAYRILVAQAYENFKQLSPTNLSGVHLDEVETALRWASKIKVALMASELHLVLMTIENHIGGPIDSLEPKRIAQLLLGGIGVAASAMDRYNPDHGGRLAAPIALALTRYSTRQPDVAKVIDDGKAARRIASGFVVADWTRTVSPWQRWLDPDPRIEGVLDRLDEEDRMILMCRYGLGGFAPQTIEVLAERLGLPRVRAVQRLRRAYRAGLGVMRGGVR